MTTAPFAPQSISLRLYPHNELPATELVDELCQQARLGLTHGFDGIMLSEHHGGVGGYLPNPLQMSGFVLADNDHGWAAACPLLLPLRPTALVAEEVAWLDARHPARVGLGVAAGGRPVDFTIMDLPPESATSRFKQELPRIVSMLRGQDLGDLAQDPALVACAPRPIPVLSAAVSSPAARRAASVGAGILMEGVSPLARLTAFCRAYDEAGGAAGKVLIRRVWLGEPLEAIIESQRRFYQSFRADGGELPEDQTIAVDDPGEMADRLAELVIKSGSDCINIRVHLPGIPAPDIRDQIVRLGEEMVPRLRAQLAPSG